MALRHDMQEFRRLKSLALKRPVIKEVLGFNLNPNIYTEEIKDMQWDLYMRVLAYQDDGGEELPDYELNQAEEDVIMISCCRMLRWIGRHPTHAWKYPTWRLLNVMLDNYDVEPEKEDYREVYKRYSLFGI